MTNDKALAPLPNPETDPEWREIISDLFEMIHKDDLPEKVVEATEMLLVGTPTYKVAQRLNVEPKTVRSWLSRYPQMALAVNRGRALLSQWRMSKLEQQFLQAVEKSEQILDLDLSDREVNSKLVGVVAQQSRFIIGLFMGQQIDVNVKVEEGNETLKAKADALQYLADQLVQQRVDDKPVTVEYVVQDGKFEDEQPKPALDHEGNPAFGELGVLDTNDEGTLCHVCGKRVPDLHGHITGNHKMKIKDFEIVFMLPLGSVEKLRDNGTQSG